MKPIRLELQAFGPYAEYESVDFARLADNGLFLICGETGSGKTMLLDAMTFALFGKSSGNVRDDFSAMRCTRADFDITTFVIFVFENNGEYYHFERRLERKRKNLSASYNVMKRDESGNWNPLFENPKEKDLNNLAVELIGLDYNQFRQVIVLPQGQFERLLTSGSDEKEKILTSIFGEDRWKAYAEHFYAEASSRVETLKNKMVSITAALMEEDCSSIAELTEQTEAVQRHYEELEQSIVAKNYDEKIKELQDKLTIAARFEDLKNAYARRDELLGRKSVRVEHEEKLKKARIAEEIVPSIKEYEDDKTEVTQREERLNNERKNNTEAAKSLEETEKRIAEHNKSEEDNEKRKRLIVEYTSKKEIYKKTVELEAELTKCDKEYTDMVSALSICEENTVLAANNVENARKLYDELINEHAHMFAMYNDGISGYLASKLTDGMACPVCGSTTHPCKAALSEDSYTLEDVDEKKAEADEQYEVWQEAIKAHEAQKNRLDKQKAKVSATGAARDTARKLLDENKCGLIEGISSLDKLLATIDELQDMTTKFEDEKKNLDELLNSLSKTVTENRTRIETYTEEYNNAKDKLTKSEHKLNEVVRQKGFKSVEAVRKDLLDKEQMDALVEVMAKYDADVINANKNIEELCNELEGIENVNKSDVEEQLQTISQEYRKNTEEVATAGAECKRLSEKLGRLRELGSGIEDELHIAEEDMAFAKKLRGDTGTGLQRYVLGIMFSSVIGAANKMLELVHDGRYRLFRSDEKVQGSNKRGLELKVYDKYSADEDGRFVNTLSGGEKFLISLALSIGMSTIAGKGGIKIEALFIDEGFGSLDENSIVDAMNVLNSIQAANGMVGIISHVQLLQERIPSKINVKKSNGYSKIESIIG